MIRQLNDRETRNNTYYPKWNLLQALQEQFKNYKFLFCIGADLIDSLHRWKNGDMLMNEVLFIVLKTPEYPPEKKNSLSDLRILDTISD